MTSIFAPRPADRPPQSEDYGLGATMSFVAHAALIGALVWGVNWKSRSEPEGATAELWAAVPQAIAPPPVATPQPETPPPPPKPVVEAPPPPPPVAAPKPPDIVTEQDNDKKKKLEQQKQLQQQVDQQKADKAKADKQKADQQKLDDQKLAKLRDENLRRMMGQMDAPADATGRDARNAGPSASYLGRVIGRLRPNLTFTDTINGNPNVEVDINCAPDGTIIGRRIVKSSGSKAWDDAVLRAIDKTGTLPRDTNGKAPSTIPISWNYADAQ